MNDKNENNVTYEVNGEPEIFGRSKSREELREERKAEKKAQRAAYKEARRALREQKQSNTHTVIIKERRPEMWVMGGILIAVVIGCVVAMAVQFYQDSREAQFLRDETRTTYFLDDTATPELSDDGLTAAVNEVYYTTGGYLCVKMTLGNGLDVDQHMEDIEVEISNGETDELIASGYTAKVSDEYVVPAKGTNTYTFYISPEHVKITDDELSTISYSITVTGSEKK